MRLRFLTGALALLSFLPQCTHVSRKHPTGLKQEKFWEDQKSRIPFFERVEGRLHMSYDGPKEGAAGPGRVLFIENRLRLELRDPLGKLHYLAVSDGKKFTAYYPSRNVAYQDHVAGRSYFERFMGFRFSTEEFRDLLVGIIPSNLRTFEGWDWDDAEEGYRGTTASGGMGRFTVWVDPDRAVIRKLKWSTRDDELMVSYGDYFVVKDAAPGRVLWTPGDIAVSHRKSSSSIRIEWKDLEEARKSNFEKAFELLLPKGVSLVSLPSKDGR